MNEALVGLIGVVVGALASGLATYLIDRAAARRQLVLRRRAAARLIEDELDAGLDTLALIHDAIAEQIESERAAAGDVERHVEAIESRSQPSKLLQFQLERGYLSEPSGDAWNKHEHQLAEALGDDDWRTLVRAHRAITRGRPVAAAKAVLERGSFEDDPPVLLKTEIDDAIEKLQQGLVVVRTLSRAGDT